MLNGNYSDVDRFYRLGKGILITIPFFEDEPEKNYFSIDDFEELNVGFNEHNIFIAPDPIGGAGGAGGVYIPPQTIQTLQLIIRDVAIGISSSLLYDGLKEAIKLITKLYREKKGLPKEFSYQILRNQESFSIIVVNGEVDDKILDSSLRSLLNGTTLKETHDSDLHAATDQGVG